MSKPILNVESPKTQSLDAVKALLSWRSRGSDPLPSFVEMGDGEGRMVLVLSNKKDCFYVTTVRACSCPAAVYNRGPCKHQRKHFGEELAAIGPKPKPAGRGKWPGGMNGPIDPEEIEAAKAASSPSSIPLVDCLGEPTPGELAYQSIKADREMWPAEA
jgi:hypothetical protein